MLSVHSAMEKPVYAGKSSIAPVCLAVAGDEFSWIRCALPRKRDGAHSSRDMAERASVSFAVVYRTAQLLQQQGLLTGLPANVDGVNMREHQKNGRAIVRRKLPPVKIATLIRVSDFGAAL